MEKKFIVAIDQGTTGTTMLLVDHGGHTRHKYYRPFAQHYPEPGWVEHDPMVIWETVRDGLSEILALPDVKAEEVAAIGITNQRETVILWDRQTGKPVYPAIVWQCRRTTDRCATLINRGCEPEIAAKTGLRIDPYFSATKLEWLLDNIPGVRTRAEKGELAAGTIDTWLMWKLTGGRIHATDPTNASRTLLYNIHLGRWDHELLTLFNIPDRILPTVEDSDHYFGDTDPALTGTPIPIHGVLGDQQAALFGQGCYSPGSMKNTYGTGCFLLMNTGKTICRPRNGLLSTIAWKLGDRIDYALEGSVFIGGAAIQWLRDEMGLIEKAADSEEVSLNIPDTNGCFFVPAFTGLGAPYWDPYARGIIVGLTRGTNRSHIVRAALESIAYQVREVVECMTETAGTQPPLLRVDGGAAANNFLLQFQADISNLPIQRGNSLELTGLGASFVAGLGSGFWPDMNALKNLVSVEKTYNPTMTLERRATLWNGWRRAVERAKCWEV